MSERGVYGRPLVGQVTDDGVRRLGSDISFAGLLVAMGLVGAAVIKRVTKLSLAGR